MRGSVRGSSAQCSLMRCMFGETISGGSSDWGLFRRKSLIRRVL